MASNAASDFLRSVSRDKQLHGAWLPLVYWTNKLSFKLKGINSNKLYNILEGQGILNTVLTDHGSIHIEVLSRSVVVDGSNRKRLFICISSPDKPELDRDRTNSKQFKDVLQKAWDNNSNSRTSMQQQQEQTSAHKDEEPPAITTTTTPPATTNSTPYNNGSAPPSPRLLSQNSTETDTPPSLVASPTLQNDINNRLKAANKQVKAVEKKKEHGALSQPVRQKIEHMMQTVYRIIRSAYHGGDFEGNHCRKFMRNAEAVMDDIQELLLAIPESERAAGCDDYEIAKYCAAYQRLFQYFDLLIHYCQQPLGNLTDNDMADVRKLVGMLDRLWRRLFDTVPPKAHAWQHLVVDLERLRGLKHHQESKIEVSHQVGRKIDLQFRAVNDIDKKIQCSLSHQYTMEQPVIKNIQQLVRDKQSRKRKSMTDGNTAHIDQIRAVLTLPEVWFDFPTLLELSKQARLEERARASLSDDE